MLDSQNDKDSAASNAQEAYAFAAKSAHQEEILRVTGASWAEYHLLLGESSHHCTRIEREIRTFGGAPTIAVLLAKWAAENPETAHLAIEISLTLGRDPNARLLRRELQNWQEKLPNLRVRIQDDEAAPEVAYRILMWPREPASTCSAPQVLECGEIGRYCKIGPHGREGVFNTLEFMDGAAAIASAAWANILGRSRRQMLKLSLAAGACWIRKPAQERIACELSWGEVEAAARETQLGESL